MNFSAGFLKVGILPGGWDVVSNMRRGVLPIS